MISRLNVRAICLIVNVVQCKSGAPVFILLFAFAFRLEVPSLKLLGIIVIISFGVMLTVAKETEFQLEGFILVMLSTVMAGFRWTVTQLLLQKEEYGLNNPFVAMSYFTPLMALITVVFSLALEPWHKLGSTAFFDSTFHIFESCALMLLGGTLAFFMVMAEYLLISETSAVTMTIAGVIKEVVTVVVAVFFFHDPFTVLKGVGLVIIIFGVALFNWFKYKKLVEGNLGNHNGIARQETEQIPLKYMTLEDASAAIFQIEDEPEHVL
jgi:solute carrier family 35 protein C2